MHPFFHVCGLLMVNWSNTLSKTQKEKKTNATPIKTRWKRERRDRLYYLNIKTNKKNWNDSQSILSSHGLFYLHLFSIILILSNKINLPLSHIHLVLLFDNKRIDRLFYSQKYLLNKKIGKLIMGHVCRLRVI